MKKILKLVKDVIKLDLITAIGLAIVIFLVVPVFTVIFHAAYDLAVFMWELW